MYNKYKIRKKKSRFNLYIIIVFGIITMFFGVGYSFFSTHLEINGTAKLINNDIDIPVEIQPGTEGGTDYVSLTVADNVLEVIDQAIVGDTVQVNLRPTTSTGKPRNMDIIMNFANNSNYTYTNGSVTCEITGDTGFIRQQPTVTITTTLQPGEEGSISAHFSNLKFNSLTRSCICKFTIKYIVNDIEKSFYIILNITK